MNVPALLGSIKYIKEAYLKLCEPLLVKYNLTQTAFDILMFLANNPECENAKDVSKKRNIKPNLVSMNVDKLVSDGYLVREMVEGDRRKIKLIPTDKTKDIIKQGHRIQKEYHFNLINGLTKEDLKQFNSYFETIVTNAKNMKEGKLVDKEEI